MSEALLLSASRFLDIDPSEFSSGFRIVPADTEEQLGADVYLFDTLAGGAGYADQAGRHIDAILETTLTLLERCPGGCTHSCQECLRHYANQYWHDRLDRHLAAYLLRYTLYGTIPDTRDLIDQQRRLHSLQRMLELDEYSCIAGAQVSKFSIPLLVETSRFNLAIWTYNGLLNKDSENFKHPLFENIYNDIHDMKVEIINDYLLERNLPDVYQIIKKLLES